MIDRLVPSSSGAGLFGAQPRAPSAEKSRKSSAKRASSKGPSVKNADTPKAPEAPPAQVQVVKEADPFDNNENLNRFAAMGK